MSCLVVDGVAISEGEEGAFEGRGWLDLQAPACPIIDRHTWRRLIATRRSVPYSPCLPWLGLQDALSSSSGIHTIEVIAVSLGGAPPPTLTLRTSNQPAVGGLTVSPSGCACHFDPRRLDCACCSPGACQCAFGLHSKCVRCEPSQPVQPPVESVAYTYTYPNGSPRGWGGGDAWFDDLQLS